MLKLRGEARELLEILDEDESVEKGDQVEIKIDHNSTSVFEVEKIYRKNDVIEVRLEAEQ